MRHYEDPLTAGFVVAREATVLILGVDDIRVFRIELRFVAVAEQDQIHIDISDPVAQRRA